MTTFNFDHIVSQIPNEVAQSVNASLAWSFGSMLAGLAAEEAAGRPANPQHRETVEGLFGHFYQAAPTDYRPVINQLIDSVTTPPEADDEVLSSLPEELKARAIELMKEDSAERSEVVANNRDSIVSTLKAASRRLAPDEIPYWAARLIIERAILKTEDAIDKELRRTRRRSRTLAARAAANATLLQQELESLVQSLDEVEALAKNGEANVERNPY